MKSPFNLAAVFDVLHDVAATSRFSVLSAAVAAACATAPVITHASTVGIYQAFENPRGAIYAAVRRDMKDFSPWIAPLGLMKMMRGAGRPVVLLTISATQTVQYNIFTSAGSPTVATEVILTINTTIVCRAGVTTSSGWPAGSSITIVNNGTIAGIGGTQSSIQGRGGETTSSVNITAGQAGRTGGVAVYLSFPITIDNTNGNVFGGGGQGGGGGASTRNNPPGTAAAASGGGGGGGRGYNNAPGGLAGADNNNTFITVNAGNGGAGSSTAGGASGANATAADGILSWSGGDGGAGSGTWAGSGGAGTIGTKSGTGTVTSGGVGGAGGAAVARNGHSLTWTGGNNSTQVKGSQT